MKRRTEKKREARADRDRRKFFKRLRDQCGPLRLRFEWGKAWALYEKTFGPAMYCTASGSVAPSGADLKTIVIGGNDGR